MKRILLLSLGIICINLIFGQIYKPVLKNSNSWSILWGSCDVSSMDSLYSITDSISNSTIYASLYRSNLPEKIGLLNEDTLAGRITLQDFENEEEFLIYDISLVVGDTFNFYGWGNELNRVTVSHIYELQGLKHIEFDAYIQLCNIEGIITFIESVGPNIGLQYQGNLNSIISNTYLLCNFRNGVFHYGNSLFDDECYIDWTGIENSSNQGKIKVIYSYGKLKVINLRKRAIIEIYNVLGNKVSEENMEIGNSFITMKGLSSGLYLYIIRSNNKVLISDKFYFQEIN
jgi:hypothetical protein